MRSWLGFVAVVALTAGVGITGCGRSLRVPGRDAAGSLDVPSGLGGVVGAGGALGVGGAIARAGAGGSARGGAGGGGGDAGADASGGIDATVVDPTQLCEMWRTRASARDTLDLQAHGLFEAGMVFTGTLMDFVEPGDAPYALLSIDRVHAGIRPYEGLVTAIRIDRPQYEQLGKGAKVIAGFRDPHPLANKTLGQPVWDQPQALLAQSSTVAAELLGFHAWRSPNVAVVRVEELREGGMTFAVVESLRGELPSTLVVSLSSSWPPLGADVGSTWIGAFSDLITGSTRNVSLHELWPDTPDARAEVTGAFATLEPTGFAPRYQAGLEQAQAEAVRLRLGWLYNQADLVATLEVSGSAMECCTNAGGIYYASSVLEVLHGPAPTGPVLTGGHGYYGQKACGERFLYAFGSPIVLADGLELDCQEPKSAGDGPASRELHELQATAENLALARQWVASAPPLLRLYPAGGQFPAEAFAPPAGIALWSTPVSALTAVLVGTPVVLTIVSATKQAEGYVVKLRTPFYTSELSHLEEHEVEVAFACADPRLLEVGTRWLGSVVGTEVVSAHTVTTLLEQGRLFLVPGLLLPERIDLVRALGLLPTVAIQ